MRSVKTHSFDPLPSEGIANPRTISPVSGQVGGGVITALLASRRKTSHTESLRRRRCQRLLLENKRTRLFVDNLVVTRHPEQ